SGMADLFNKHIKKATSRTKEKLLESVGKAQRTQDEAFDFHAGNLNKQAKACERLHKDLKVYAEALKKLTEAEKNLHESVRQAYETEWPDREHVVALSNTLDIQADELEKKVNDELMGSVTAYVGQFTDLKKKVDKRGRKLVDYDHAKNNFNSLKASSKKGDADPKVTKAFTELTQAEQLYKEMNKELLEVLPATYDSRITFLVDTLQTLFNSRSTHQTECAKLHKQLVTQLDALGVSMDSLRVARPEGLSTTPQREESPSRSTGSPAPTPSPLPQHSPAPSSGAPSETAVAPTPTKRTSIVEEKFENQLYPKLNSTPGAKESSRDVSPAAPRTPESRKDSKESSKDSSKEVPHRRSVGANPFGDDDEDEKTSTKENDKKSTNPFDEEEDEEIDAEKIEHEIAGGRKVMYLVRSTHEYKAVDTDELSFASGELIKVIESKTEDNLDDGWNMGVTEDGSIGVFPENFTKRE
ncbi:amph-1, partial [Pristionchus pacificus]